MGKRASRGAPPNSNPRKRVKVAHEAPTCEDVTTSRQLRQLLAFEQDLGKARHGLQSFKVFLDNFSSESSSERLGILSQYLQASTPKDHDDPDAVYLEDVMATWNYASQMGNDDVLSAVTVVLALLLKVVSEILDLRPQGLGICRTLLQKRQLELLAKNLSADKAKAFIISPTLRLVREAVCFDGGALARAFFRARKYAYDSLTRNMRIKFLGEGVEDSRRISPRTNAIRLLMSSLKFLHWEAKRELLYERDLAGALTSSIKDDPPYLILEVLDGLKSHVLMDKHLPAETKSRLLNTTTLTRLALLYAYNHTTPSDAETRPVDDTAHEFLMTVCTSSESGALRTEFGLYPKGVDPNNDQLHDSAAGSDVSLDRIVWANKFKEDVPVHNTTLSEFIKTLRPWNSPKQSELIIAVFRAAPELIADYFLGKRDFTFEPKLSATWIGYAALLFNTVQLPLPPFFGSKDGFSPVPPPISLVLDNILPLPVSQKVLVRCLSHESKLVSFFATRLLVLALQKLDMALQMMHDASSTLGPLWSEAARKLTDEFSQRCPDLKYATTAFRGIPEDDLLSREAGSRLLRLYYQVIPQVALLAKFDVSPLLVNAIKRLDRQGRSTQDQALALVELENLVAVAKSSPGMRWFAKAESPSLSPFTSLLKVHLETPEGILPETLESTLAFVATEHEFFLSEDQEGFALRHLFVTLNRLHARVPITSSTELWGFLDNCLQRCSATPIRYIELAQELAPNTKTSPLTATINEQLPFIVRSGDASALAVVKEFVSVYTTVARAANEHEPLLKALQKPVGAAFIRKMDTDAGKIPLPESPAAPDAMAATEVAIDPSQKDHKSYEALSGLAADSEILGSDNSALLRWTTRSVGEIIDEGYASSLVALLSSSHTSIRKEALTNIFKMAAKIKESSHEEKDQVWLLLVELAESCKTEVDKGPAPGQIVAFARRALDVLKNPLHCLYDKVNTFLTRGPVWSLDRFPLLHEVLQEAPSRDDSYYASVSWLLGYLLESLHTPSDLALFHKRRVYERILSLASNSYMRLPLRSLLLRIVYRTTCLEGGSTTLITRFGVISWLETQRAQRSSAVESELLKALQQRIWDTCDQERIQEWSRKGITMVIDDWNL
ncbi:hypothetical protein RB594_006605 [Gaeumannomyces avenae]